MPPKIFYVPSCIHRTLSTYIAAKSLPLQNFRNVARWSFIALNGNFSSEWAVRLPSNNMAAIPDEESASEI
jgi:hypothetical protein